MANPTEIKFGDPATRIAQTGHWTVLLRPKQPTLGSLVLVCREPVRAFAELSAAAYANLRAVVRCVEPALREVSAYERINYLMLMMVDPDVHFHVIPRYGGSRRFMGADYPDAGWPGPPDLQTALTPEADARNALLERLRVAYESHRAREMTRA
ncbi:MAG TPA: HIT family protein [Steroidobacteraceae bacterium]